MAGMTCPRCCQAEQNLPTPPIIGRQAVDPLSAEGVAIS